MSMLSELRESPAVVAALLDRAWPGVEDVAGQIRARGLDLAVVAARGTSDHAALYGQYILGARNAILVAPAAPSLVSLYGAPPRMSQALVVGISQSGRSPDVISVLAAARGQGALTLAVTNDRHSDLAKAADHVIDLGAGPELAIAATKTYVAELTAIAMLSAALTGDERSAAELRAVPAALAAALDQEAEIAAIAADWPRIDHCAVLARGFHFATAREWALKLKEVAHTLADPYSAADFQHGPITLIEPGFPVLAVATEGPALAGMADLMTRLNDAGARLLAMTDVPAFDEIATVIRMPSVPEWLSPIVAVVPAQLFAYHLALARGVDLEHPRNLSKVTLTT